MRDRATIWPAWQALAIALLAEIGGGLLLAESAYKERSETEIDRDQSLRGAGLVQRKYSLSSKD